MINALENIRSTSDYLNRARSAPMVEGARRLLQLADADIDDALQVLAQGELHQEDVVPRLEHSKELVVAAIDAADVAERDSLIDSAVADAENGRALMVVAAPSGDTTKPTVAILAPADGGTVSGPVTISADASDDVGVDSVIFKVGQTQIGQDATAPYQVRWDTTLFADGFNQITVTMDNIPDAPCTVYSCPNPPPPPSEPPPPPVIAPGSSPEGEFGSVLDAKDMGASTVTITTDTGLLTLKITSQTQFVGSFATNISELLVGHVVQGEFFQSIGEIVWIEADLPLGL